MADDLPRAAWTIQCDGSAVPNPGRMGLGAVITRPDGTQHTLSVATQATGCNNEAELRALMSALQWVLSDKAAAPADSAEVLIACDNSIVVAQLSDSEAPPVTRLAPLFDQARALLVEVGSCRLVWVPRRRNAQADALARAALGLGPKVQTHGKRRR